MNTTIKVRNKKLFANFLDYLKGVSDSEFALNDYGTCISGNAFKFFIRNSIHLPSPNSGPLETLRKIFGISLKVSRGVVFCHYKEGFNTPRKEVMELLQSMLTGKASYDSASKEFSIDGKVV